MSPVPIILDQVEVNWSSDEVADVPAAVTTVTSTVPVKKEFGDVTVIDPSEFTMPKRTELAPVKPLPLRVRLVPPAVLPLLVPRPLTTGAEAALTVKRSPDTSAEVVPWAVTVTSLVPADCGVTATRVLKMGTPEARELLKGLAETAPEGVVRDQAKASLERLAKPKSPGR